MKTKEEVLSILKTHPNGNIEEPQFKKKFPEHYQILSTWDFPSDFKFTQKLFHYFNNDPELKLGLCPVCGKRCKFIKFNKGYHIYCSKECVQNDNLIQDKKKKTCLEKYGVENYSQTDEYKERMKKTCLEKYGVEYSLQSPIIRYKGIQTCLEKYGDKNYNNVEKAKLTKFEKYGDENYNNVEKARQTSLEKYGVTHYSYSTEFSKRYKQFCLQTYGTINSFQSNLIKKKSKQTCIQKYGSDYYTQTSEYAKTRKKKFNYNNITFDSNWEIIVYQYCKENNIPCEYQPNVKLEYEYNDKKHYYQPDFLINGKLYEVKGDHFFEGDKMICPYDRDEYKDGLAEAKHQCMIKNNVIILKRDDIIRLREML